jgi:hypothetical protein
LAELGRLAEFELVVLNVDEEAVSRPELRAQFGDRLPVVLLDGAEHSCWELDAEELLSDLRK